MKLIDKDALVAEIERLEKKNNESENVYDFGTEHALKSILFFLDTLKVKVVDLEKELQSWRHNHFHGKRDREANGEYLERVSQLDIAKHFYELGLKVQENQNIDDIKREWYNKGYLKGRKEAHIPARELGLPKVFDFKPLNADLERDAVSFCFDNGLNTTPHTAKTIAKHFYELGMAVSNKVQKGK